MKEIPRSFVSANLDDINQENIKGLQDEVRKHRQLYNEENPIISDKEYDELYRLLVQAEKKYKIDDSTSPTQQVDHLVESQFTKASHAYPMASLDNTYDAGDLEEFEKRIFNILKKNPTNGKLQTENYKLKTTNGKLSYMVELKFDGLGVALTYEDGKLIRGLTRGNGIQGEDITINILHIDAIPKSIPYTDGSIEIRGEVVMPIASFEKLNANRMEAGERLFSNPRNAASGSLRQKDWRVTASRELDFFAYSCPALEANVKGEVIHDKGIQPYNLKLITYNYENLIGKLNSWGFHVSPYFKKFKGIAQVISEIESMNGKPVFPFEIDGLVIKVDDLALWEMLGNTAHHPRSAISYKFPSQYSRTKIESIQHCVGRTGTVTPVANVTAVNIGGAVVRRATLHNYEDMEKKGVMIGDDVWIHRAGEVIPEIIGPILESRDGSEQEIAIPIHCPICKNLLKKDGEKVALVCTNSACPAKVSGGLEWFVSKHGLDIDGLGPAQIELFIEKGWVTDMASVFDVPDYAPQILALEGYQETAVNNLVASLQKAKQQPAWKVIAALGIRGVGKRTAKTIAPLFTSKQDFLDFTHTVEELEAIRDVGPETAKNIIEYFANNKELIARLLDRIEVQFDQKTSPGQGGLGGLSFCVTGSFEAYSRDQIHEIIEEHGGEVRTSVSAKLDYLIAGDKAGSKKAKAQMLGVLLLSIDDFLEMIV